MTRVVLDTNVVVSALLAPAGTQASVCTFPSRSSTNTVRCCARPRFKLDARQIHDVLRDIRAFARFVQPPGKLSVSPDEPDNRLLECAKAAQANYLVTGNIRHFPAVFKGTKVVSGRRFLDIIGEK